MTPFVGKNFNVTKAGIHADGLMKDEEIYNIFDTNKFLNRPAGVMITKTAGLAGIAYWINEYFSLKDERKIDKHDPLVTSLKEWVDKEYENGRVSALSDEEILAQIDVITNGVYPGNEVSEHDARRAGTPDCFPGRYCV